MLQREAIVIGAGLGGLACGRILSGSGWRVTLLEKGTQPGGALRTFVRDGIRFDTGFHSVGGLGPGEPLERCFRQLGLTGLPWIRMEADELADCRTPFLRLSAGSEEERQHVLEPYRQSIWRLEGGGKTLADALAAGQRILLRKKVTAIADRSVRCADGSVYRADCIVSDLHPLTTMRLVRDPFRPAYLHRLEKLPNGPGIRTVHVKLKAGRLPYHNRSIFLRDEVMIHFGAPDAGGYARSLDLLAFQTAGLSSGQLLRKAAAYLPGLSAAVERCWTRTPADWERCTGSPGGSAYGILKHSPDDYLSPRTPLPWLYLTGQNLGLHGILGTTVSAFNTCKSITL